MDDDYASSENEQDELMDEADDMEADNDAEDDNEEDEDEQDEQDEADAELEPEPEGDGDNFDGSQPAGPDGQGGDAGESSAQGAQPVSTAPASPITGKWRPIIREEYINAPIYDIVPTMAAPQATSINALAVTPDLRYWMTGGTDGYIRKHDGMGTINGKQQLTVAQRHPFVDSVVKAGILMGYWGNEEPGSPGSRSEDAILSPVYSLAVHSQALWLLSGLESGGINLYSVRYDEGKRIHCLTDGHTNAVSVLQLAPDEKTVLSGSWDKMVLDWDLNTGNRIRRFEGSGGQISALELRPASCAPFPAEAAEVEIKSDTFDSNESKTVPSALFSSAADGTAGAGGIGGDADDGGPREGAGSPDSLFGSGAESLFGDNDTMGGGGAFGNDDDDEFSRAMKMDLHNDDSNPHELDNPGEFSMGDTDMSGGPSLDLGPPSTAAPAAGTAGGKDPAEQSNGVASESTITSSDTLPLDPSFSQTQSELETQTVPSSLPNQPPPGSASDQLHDSAADTSGPAQPPASPTIVYSSGPASRDQTQTSANTFMAAAIEGSIRIWDRRTPDPVARINVRRGVPPWCMGACWSPDGNFIYAGRRNGTVEEFSIHKARAGWQPERTLKFPAGSGAVSCVRAMPNGRHLVCASHDILRLYDLRDDAAPPSKHSRVPFIIVPGPPRAGVISHLYIDPTSRIMISTAGTRGWDGTSTEVLIGYEINVPRS